MSEERKIIFKHSRALGDGLMFTAGVRDFALLFPNIRINVDSNQKELWDNNPYIDRTLKKGDEGVEYYRVGYPMVGNANNTNMHFTSMFLFDMIAIADLHKPLGLNIGEFCAAYANGEVGDPDLGNKDKNNKAYEPFISLHSKYRNFCKKFTRQRGDIHLSEHERTYNMVRDLYGVDTYWVIAPGGKRDCTTKVWDWRRFQKVVDYFDGKIKFVVIGKSDLLIEPLNNVINLVDKFNKNIRDLISLVYHADGCVSGPSFLMHLSAAVPPKYCNERKPCVSIFGGREPSSWSWYCNHQVLHTNGIFDCCSNGGCWMARTVPLPKDPKHNEKLCHHIVKDDDRSVQACMDLITADDVIRAIERYYDGNLYNYSKTIQKSKSIETIEEKKEDIIEVVKQNNKVINLLGNLNTKGGGEQSLCMIAKLLKRSGWDVHVYPWGDVHDNYKNLDINIQPYTFNNGMYDHMRHNVPLLFYANDCIWDFVKHGENIVNKSSDVIVGINFCNGSLPKANWLSRTKKLKAVIFQNEEKKSEFEHSAIGFDDTRLISMFGAIDIDKFLEVHSPKREKNQQLVVLKHCVADNRKYVTKESFNSGEKIHIWQKHLFKDVDTKFYSRLLKDTKNIRFEFMEAPRELVDFFKDNERMVFHKWNAMSVSDFLKRGHVYLYRTSNAWRDQYPRVIAEALAVGLPVLTEPRDGTKDRVIHGDTGFYCVDYDGFLYALKMMQRKEDYRVHLCRNAKDWARINLNPNKWVNTLEEILV